MKKSFGEKVALLAKSQGKSQTEISDKIGMAPSQLNRFFKGNSDCTSDNLLAILDILEVDLENIVSRKTRKTADIDDVENVFDAVTFLYKNLNPLGQQTQLRQLEKINQLSGKQKIPKVVQDIIKKETNLI